jgi:hypothetical protein
MFGRVRPLALWLFAAACASEPRTLRFAPPDLRGVLAGGVLANAGAPADSGSVAVASEPRPGSLPLAATPGSAPVVLETAAPDASWTVVCEANVDTDGSGSLEVSVGPRGELRGDRLQRYLGLPNGRLEAIDDFVTASDDGRFVVVRRAGRSELCDTRSAEFRELPGVDTRGERTLPARQRVRSMGGALWFVRRSGTRSELVERALSTGEERLLYAGSEEIVGLEIDPAGHFVIAEVGSLDGNAAGRLSEPSPGESERACGSPIPEARARRKELDASGYLLVPRAGGKARRVDDLALVFGHQLIRRRVDGALLLEREGRSYVLGTDACQGRVLFGEPERQLLLIGCALPKKPWRFGVELWTGLTRRTLPIDVAALAADELTRPGVRLFPLYPGPDTLLFDARRQSLRRFEPGDLALAVHEDHALIRRGRTALIYDARSDQLRALPGKLDAFSEALQTGPMVHASPFVVDLTTGRWVGNVSGRPLALSISGAVLLPAVPATAEALARGPLFWQSPEPPP